MSYVIDYQREREYYEYCEHQNDRMAKTFLNRSIDLSFLGRRNDDLGLVPLFVDY